MGAHVIQVIETDLLRRGSGEDETDPIRVVRQYWTLEGDLLAEVDPGPTRTTLENITRKAYSK